MFRTINILFVLILSLLVSACLPFGPARGSYMGENAIIRRDDGSFVCNPTGSEPTRFDGPDQVVDPSKQYMATIEMASGDLIYLALFIDDAPIAVNNFVFLACQGFYDGVTFHRVIPDFMAQSGDPGGTGRGDPGYTIEGEVLTTRAFDRGGLLAMANRGQIDTAGSQFFITFAAAPHLNGGYTIFGEVIDGMDVVDTISPRDPASATVPGDSIASIRIQEIN